MFTAASAHLLSEDLLLSLERSTSSRMARLQTEHDSLKTLSPREREVLNLLLAGKSQVEIASDLGISPKTVHTYKTCVRGKLACNSEVDLVKFAVRHHLTDLWTASAPLPQSAAFVEMGLQQDNRIEHRLREFGSYRQAPRVTKR